MFATMEVFLKLTLSLFLLLPTISCSETYAQHNSTPSAPTAFPHANPLIAPTRYILAIQWPSGVCSQPQIQPCKNPIPKYFTIHGLWPSPSSNDKRDYDPAALSAPLRTKMGTLWPNLFVGRSPQLSNDIYWEKQWAKHGKDQLMSQGDYFQMGITLYNAGGFNLLSALEKEGVEPRLQPYKLTELQAALLAIYNVQVQIVCGKHFHFENQQQVVEIRIRYSASFDKEENIGGQATCTNPLILFNP